MAMSRETIRKVNERIAAEWRGRRSPWVGPWVAGEIRDFESVRYEPNLHDQTCAGRRCLNPEHYGEEVIDVQAMPERKAITDGGE